MTARLFQFGLAILRPSMIALALVVTSAPTAQFAVQTRPVAFHRSTRQELLQRVKQALRAPDKSWAATMVSGKALRGGVEHAYSFAFLPDGRFVQTFQGSNSKTFGNDGRRYWQEDRSRFVQELEFGARDRQMLINLLLSDNWLFAPAPIELTAGENVVHVRFKETGVAVDIRIDPSTYLPTDASFQIPSGTTLRLSDWRVAGDRRIPMHAEVTTHDETETYGADEAEPIRPGDVDTAMPKPKVSDATFDPVKPATVESSFAGRTHIKVRALVNGQDAGWFILDSGAAGNVIYDRTPFKLEKGVWQRLRFSSDNPAVLARVAGTPKSWYRLDTGASGFLTLHTPFVEKWKLLEGRETTASSSTGIDGTVTARTGTIQWFELGSHRFDRPTVDFSTANVGGFADAYLAGNIGIDVLKPFTVVLDFAGSRVAFLE